MARHEETAPFGAAKLHLISFRTYLIVYIVVLLVITLFASLFFFFKKATLQSLAEVYMAFVTSVGTANDAVESTLVNSIAPIYYSSKVQNLRTSPNLSNAEIIEAMRELNTYSSICPFVDTIYVYNQKQDYIYSTSDIKATNNSFEQFVDKEAVALFSRFEEAQRLTPIYRSTRYTSYSTNANVYSYLMFGKQGDGALMLNISAEWLNSLIFADEPFACIVDDNGTFVVKQSWDEDQALLMREAVARMFTNLAEQGQGYLVWDLGGEPLICFYARMGGRGWYYLKVEKYNERLSGLLAVQKIIYCIFGAVAALGIFAALLLLIRIFFPYQRLSTTLRQIDGLSDQASSEVTLDQLIARLNKLVAVSSHTEHIHEAFHQMLREEVIRSLLLGEGGVSNAFISLDDLILEPGSPITPVLINNIRLNENLALAREMIRLSEGTVLSSAHTVLLLQPENMQQLTDLCQQLQVCNPAHWVVVGRYITDWTQLPKEYTQLIETFNRRFLYSNENLLSVSCLQNLSEDISDLEKLLDKLQQALKNGNTVAAGKTYQALIALMPAKSNHAVRTILTDLSKIVLRIYYEACPQKSHGPDKYSQARKQFELIMINPDTMEDFNSYFYNIFKEITGYVQQNRKEKREGFMLQIENVLQQEYANPALSSQYLADLFSISPVYLCRVFKKILGCSMTDYLNQLRIQQSCKLLSQQDSTIKDIAQAVGFENSQYFYAIFKRYTSMTPTQYRSINGYGEASQPGQNEAANGPLSTC